MNWISKVLVLGIAVIVVACHEDPSQRPPEDAAVDELRLFDPPDARPDTGVPEDAAVVDAGSVDAAGETQWDLFVLRVLVEPPSSAPGWDADGTVDPTVTITAGGDVGTTDVRADVRFVSGWAGAAWLDPAVVTTESHLLGGLDVSLADDDGATSDAIASCHVAIDAATLEGRLVSLSCAPGTVGYTGTGRFDVRIGLRPHGDDAPVPGSGSSVWELRMTHVTISPTDESGASWDPGGGAPDPTIVVEMLDDGPGTDVSIPVATRLADDTLDAPFDPPIVIARLPDEIRDVPGERDISNFIRLYDDDGGTLVPMDNCGIIASGGPAPSVPSETGSTFCLFDTIDASVWMIDYTVVRFGDGWL